jgi:hypothetical protein
LNFVFCAKNNKKTGRGRFWFACNFWENLRFSQNSFQTKTGPVGKPEKIEEIGFGLQMTHRFYDSRLFFCVNGSNIKSRIPPISGFIFEISRNQAFC